MVERLSNLRQVIIFIRGPKSSLKGERSNKTLTRELFNRNKNLQIGSVIIDYRFAGPKRVLRRDGKDLYAMSKEEIIQDVWGPDLDLLSLGN